MWRAAGLFRTRDEPASTPSSARSRLLERAAPYRSRSRPDRTQWRRFNLLTVARLIARAALRREESRGGHFREDFPARDDLHWKVHLIDQRPDSTR